MRPLGAFFLKILKNMDKQEQTSRQLKVEKIKDLVEKIGQSRVFAFADYHGLSANQISQLREKIKEAGGELIIAKNTLLARALQLTDYRLPTTDYRLVGPTATIFAYQDEIAPFKATFEFVKTLGFPKFKFGFFAKDFLDSSALQALCQIPGRDILHAKIVGTLSSPIYSFVNVLQANIRNLVSVLDQKAKASI